MASSSATLFEKYSPVGDLTAVAVCFVMGILMLFSYVSRGRSLRLFLYALGCLVLASLANVSWQTLIRMNNPSTYTLAFVFRIIYHAALFNIFFLYAFYITEVTSVDPKKQKIVVSASGFLTLALVAADILASRIPEGPGPITAADFRAGVDIFLIGYLINTAFMFFLLYRVRNYLFRKVMFGFYGSIAVAYIIMMVQQIWDSTSYTVVTFLLPLIAMFYIMHSTPYNAALGAVDAQSFHEMVRSLHARHIPFGFMSLYLPELDVDGSSLPTGVQAVVRRFASSYFRGSNLFQIHNGHILLLFRKTRNPDYEHRIQKILTAFKWEHQYLRYDYKIVIGESIDDISAKNEYAGLIGNVHRKMKTNTVHRLSPDDIADYNLDLYILEQLGDIHQKKDLDDPRVLAYCQPVFNLETGHFDTAEALMRLQLDKIGLVFPDQFIYLAEEYGYIHTLTEIILHKTCRAILNLTKAGYAVGRISVNVSALELKDDAFCSDINRVIREAGISSSKIAIELTESRTEDDFLLAREKMEQLRSNGIRLYLDDFGTGYTNLERIVEIPFDIIKFDRSMVVASSSDEKAGQLLESLAAVFAEMGYAVLFEGVENESDEKRCRNMSATYLQGYKYSRPVPIERLNQFFPQAG